MTKPMGRRAFLKGVAAAPAVAQRMAEEAVGATVMDTAAAAALPDGISHGVAPASGIYAAAAMLKIDDFGALLAPPQLGKTGLFPDWAKRQILRSTANSRALEPDVACLQSVSLGSKIRISADRRYTRIENDIEQEALDQQIAAQFFGWR